MEAYDAIVTRRSIRRYQDRVIPEDIVDQLLEAGMQAPSAVNKQPWHFVVVDDRELLRGIPTIHPNAAMAASAPCALVICADPALAHSAGSVPLDCSAATENVLLAAHALGLGAVWCGIYSRHDREAGFRALLAIPEQIVPFSLVVVGYPDETPQQPERYQEARVHRNRW